MSDKDTIYRQAALDAMDTWDKFGCDPDGKLVRYDDDKHYIPYVHYEDMVHVIKHLPSAQPEPKEGHWILRKSPDGGEQYECSECGVLWEFDGTPEDNEAYFCPKCGAKMDEEKECIPEKEVTLTNVLPVVKYRC